MLFAQAAEEMFLEAGVDAVDDLALFRPRVRLGAHLVENQPVWAGVVELVKISGGNVHALMLPQLVLLAVLKALDRRLPFDDEKRVVGAWVAVHLVVDTGLVAVERDVAALRAGDSDVVPSVRLVPARLFDSVERLNSCELVHDHSSVVKYPT